MKFRAVIFDLFGTLVSNIEPLIYRKRLLEIAFALGAPPEPFIEAWSQFFAHRMDGRIPDGEAQFEPVLRELGLKISPEACREANESRRAFMLESLTPKPDAVPCLQSLRAAGLRLALATDCSSETPELLDRTTLGSFFAVRAVSASLGMRKPDPAMYQHVLEGLGLSGAECLYVGDGNSEELPGAKRHGMTTVWVDNGDRQYFQDRFDSAGDHTVQSLSQIPDLVRQST